MAHRFQSIPLTRIAVLTGLALAVALLVWNHYRTQSSEMTLEGRIIISEAGNFTISGDTCTGNGDLAALSTGTAITITPSAAEPVETTLQPGTITTDGTCEITFSATVADAMRYGFHIDGLPDLTRDQYLIDARGESGELGLEPILRWD